MSLLEHVLILYAVTIAGGERPSAAALRLVVAALNLRATAPTPARRRAAWVHSKSLTRLIRLKWEEAC